MTIAPSIVGDVIERNARLFPAKTAVVFEGKRPTFAQFATRVRKLSNALAAGGLKRGMRVAILAQNCIEYFETVGTAELAGFIAVTLNWRLGAGRACADHRRLHADGADLRGAVRGSGRERCARIRASSASS